jgi:hypothetical protein
MQSGGKAELPPRVINELREGQRLAQHGRPSARTASRTRRGLVLAPSSTHQFSCCLCRQTPRIKVAYLIERAKRAQSRGYESVFL